MRRGGGEYQRSDYVMNSWAIHQSGALLLDPHLLNYLAATPGQKHTDKESLRAVEEERDDWELEAWQEADSFQSNNANVESTKPAPPQQGPPAQVQRSKIALKKAVWTLLDPHESGKEKPFKKGVTYKIPNVTGEKNKKQGTKVRGFNFPQFSYLHKAERKARNELRAQSAQGDVEELEDEPLDLEFGEYGQFANDNDFENPPEVEVDIEFPEPSEPIDRIDQIEPGDISTYEDLCRMHVQNYLTKTHLHFKQESQLTQRVQHWNERIGPLLSQQEKRPEFDLRAYKTKILNEVKTQAKRQKENRGKSQTIAPEHVIGGVEPWEVCRKFLSMLELVNAGQIDLVQGKSGFQVKLLTSSETSEISQSYLPAPLAVK